MILTKRSIGRYKRLGGESFVKNRQVVGDHNTGFTVDDRVVHYSALDFVAVQFLSIHPWPVHEILKAVRSNPMCCFDVIHSQTQIFLLSPEEVDA
jgi:hypothetical protein